MELLKLSIMEDSQNNKLPLASVILFYPVQMKFFSNVSSSEVSGSGLSLSSGGDEDYLDRDSTTLQAGLREHLVSTQVGHDFSPEF